MTTPAGSIPRTVRAWQEENGYGGSVPLSGPVTRYLAHHRFHCLIVAAHRGDGISAAAAHARKVADQVGPRAMAWLAGDDSPRLSIADVLSAQAIVRAAVRAQVDPTRPLRRRWGWGLLGILLVAALTGAVTMLGSVLDGGAPTLELARKALTNPWYIALAVVAGLAAALADLLLSLKRGPTGERLNRIFRSLPHAHPDRRAEFVASLAETLIAVRHRRCLIVDDYARLDPTTQSILWEALSRMPQHRRELWIIFESVAVEVQSRRQSTVLLGPLGGHVVAQRSVMPRGGPTPASLRAYATLLFELEMLTPQQRVVLADEGRNRGLDTNPGYFLVKDILQGAATGEERKAFAKYWPPDKVVADTDLSQSLALLYLLSLGAPPGRAVTFLKRDLPMDLVSAGPQHKVLERLLRTHATLDTVRRRLTDALQTFTRFVEEDRSRRPVLSRLSPAIQDVLVPRHAAYGLPSAGLVHLFWAIYRHRHGPAGSPAWLEPQLHHVTAAVDPSCLDAVEVSAAFVDALLGAADACLDFGEPGAAANLLDRAFDLRAEPGFPLDARELRTRSRAVYAVAADTALLSRAARDVTGEAAAIDDLLVDLFTQSEPQSAGLATLAGSDRAIGDDLRLRAVWLALSLQPLTGTALPASLPLSRSIVYAHRALPVLTQRALAEADELDDINWSPAPLVSVATALWCLALAHETLTGPILGQITVGTNLDDDTGLDPVITLSPLGWSRWMAVVDVEVAEGLEHGLHLARSVLASGPGYLRACTAHELLAVVVAAAIRIRLTWTGLQRERENRIDRLIVEGCHDLGISESGRTGKRLTPDTLGKLAHAVARTMSGIQVTWTVLGYPRAAAALNARRVQLLAGLGERSGSALGERGQNDLYGLIANLAVAADSVHDNISAEVTAGTVARLLAAHQLHEALAAQLCLLVVRLGSTYSNVDIRQHVRYLLAPPSTAGMESRLAVVLAGLADSELDSVHLAFINVASEAADSGWARTIIATLRARIGTVTEETVARALRARLDVYDLMVAARGEQQPDADTVLEAWRDRKDLAQYAYVLYLLMPRAQAPSPRLQDEIAAVFRRPLQYLQETGLMLLANRVARADFEGRLTTGIIAVPDVVAVLRRGAHRPGSRSALPLHQEQWALRHLLRLDHINTPTYRASLLDLARGQLRLLQERRLGRLLAEHQYESLFLAYWSMFQDFLAVGSVTPNGTGGAQDGPPVLFADTERSVINVDFLRELLDPGRPTARLDAQSRDGLLRVLSLLCELPDIPKDIAELLREHRQLIIDSASTDVSLRPRN